MSHEDRQNERTVQVERPSTRLLKHVCAALAVALVALGTVAATPALAQCGPEGGVCDAVPVPCDFVTSGGFVLKNSGKDANFGAHGGCMGGEFWGHVNYVDHDNGYHVDSLSITAYLTPQPGSNIRDICGMATTNNSADPQPLFFRVRLVDNGEPGVADLFGISLSNGYSVSLRLLGGGQHGGGNVQLHKPNPSTTAPDPIPEDAAACNGVAAP